MATVVKMCISCLSSLASFRSGSAWGRQCRPVMKSSPSPLPKVAAGQPLFWPRTGSPFLGPFFGPENGLQTSGTNSQFLNFAGCFRGRFPAPETGTGTGVEGGPPPVGKKVGGSREKRPPPGSSLPLCPDAAGSPAHSAAAPLRYLASMSCRSRAPRLRRRRIQSVPEFCGLLLASFSGPGNGDRNWGCRAAPHQYGMRFTGCQEKLLAGLFPSGPVRPHPGPVPIRPPVRGQQCDGRQLFVFWAAVCAGLTRECQAAHFPRRRKLSSSSSSIVVVGRWSLVVGRWSSSSSSSSSSSLSPSSVVVRVGRRRS